MWCRKKLKYLRALTHLAGNPLGAQPLRTSSQTLALSAYISACTFRIETMTINHVFVYVTAQRMAAMRSFYRSVLNPLGYTEMIRAFEGKTIGYGSDYPYLWLQQVPEGHKPYPAHVAIDAPSKQPRTCWRLTED